MHGVSVTVSVSVRVSLRGWGRDRVSVKCRLQMNTTVRTLNLYRTDLGVEGSEALLECLMMNESLTSVTIAAYELAAFGPVPPPPPTHFPPPPFPSCIFFSHTVRFFSDFSVFCMQSYGVDGSGVGGGEWVCEWVRVGACGWV